MLDGEPRSDSRVATIANTSAASTSTPIVTGRIQRRRALIPGSVGEDAGQENGSRPRMGARWESFGCGESPLWASIAALGLALLAPVAAAAPAAPPAPANDDLGSAQQIHSLPATLSGTVVGATVEPGEEGSACAAATEHSVWYSLRASSKERVAVNLAAAGALDATVDVFHAVRSELQRVGCERTDSHGVASLSFNASKNGLYEIRVAALPGSQLAGFTLEIFLPTPAVAPPGPRLPAGGAAGHVDRIQNINAAYSVVMRSGVSYLVNLANKTNGACVTARLFRAGHELVRRRQPRDAPALRRLRPVHPRRRGRGASTSIELTPRTSFKRVQRFRLQVAPAGPGRNGARASRLGNYGRARGRLDGNGVARAAPVPDRRPHATRT